MMPRVIRSRVVVIAIAIAALILLGIALVLVSRLGGDSRSPRADPENAAQVALGEQVYRAHCASCHGAELEGQPDWRARLPDGRMPAPPHDETGHTWHHPDAMLFRITKEGLAAMVPGYQSAMPRYLEVLNDEEIWAALAFIKSRWPEKVRAHQAELGAPGGAATTRAPR